MKSVRIFGFVGVITLLIAGCGVSGDPGHCFFSLDWEYYNDSYGVYYYEDNNPDVPNSEEIVAGRYYDSYPGAYEYYYESEDLDYVYTYTGVYELLQNPGTPGGLFRDGLDGADTYFDLYLFVYAKKGLSANSQGATSAVNKPIGKLNLLSDTASPASLLKSGKEVYTDPVMQNHSKRSAQHGEWQLYISETVKVYRKK